MSDDFDELLCLANREHKEKEELIAEITGLLYPENPSKAEARHARFLRARLSAWMQANKPSGLGN